MRDLVPFVQFKIREKHPWRNVTFSKVYVCNFIKGNIPPWLFFTFFKLYKWYQIAQNIMIYGLTVALQRKCFILKSAKGCPH